MSLFLFVPTHYLSDRSFIESRQAVGVRPVCLLNCLLKLLRSLNPTLSATVETGMLFRRSACARSILMNVRKLIGLIPTAFLKTRQKWYLLTPASPARRFCQRSYPTYAPTDAITRKMAA